MKANLKFIQILETSKGALYGLTDRGHCYVKTKWGWLRFVNDDVIITEAELVLFQTKEQPPET
jgi:hypothetical protein